MDPVPDEYFQDLSSVDFRGAPSVKVAKVKSSLLGIYLLVAADARPSAKARIVRTLIEPGYVLVTEWSEIDPFTPMRGSSW
jgi:hypothetical protein